MSFEGIPPVPEEENKEQKEQQVEGVVENETQPSVEADEERVKTMFNEAKTEEEVIEAIRAASTDGVYRSDMGREYRVEDLVVRIETGDGQNISDGPISSAMYRVNQLTGKSK